MAAAVVAGYLLTPDDSWTQTIYAELVGLFATGAIVVGVAKHRPAAKAAWWWFAAGQLLNVTGTLAEAVIGRVLHLETWPSAADALWLGLYPCLVIGLLLLIRRRSHGQDWGSLVDATTITGAAVVGVRDPPSGRRQLPAVGRPGGQYRLPGGRHPGPGHGHPAGGRCR